MDPEREQEIRAYTYGQENPTQAQLYLDEVFWSLDQERARVAKLERVVREIANNCAYMYSPGDPQQDNARLLGLLGPMLDAGTEWMVEAKRLRRRNAKLENVAKAAQAYLDTGRELELAQALDALEIPDD